MITGILSVSGSLGWNTASSNNILFSGAYAPRRYKVFVLASNRFSFDSYLALGDIDKDSDYVFVEKAKELEDVAGKIVILDDFCLHPDIINILKAIQDRTYIN